ncbi:MAG: putative CRISPR-associated protein [Sulfolobales archaeon]
MISYMYVCPVGTSLLQNFIMNKNPKYSDLLKKYGTYKVAEWYKLPLDDPLNMVPDGYVCNVVKGHEIFKAIYEFLLDKPREASAEINGIMAIRDCYGHKPTDVEVLLYNTRTCNSRLCSYLIRDYLTNLGYRVETIEIAGMRSVDDLDEGLVEVLDKVVRLIVRKKSEGIKVYVNATPGFKPEAAFFTIASILAGADAIIYIHDAFKQPVLLPVPPITVDTQVINIIDREFEMVKCVDSYYLRKSLGSEELLTRLIDMGVLKASEGKVCLRNWVKMLLDIVRTSR